MTIRSSFARPLTRIFGTRASQMRVFRTPVRSVLLAVFCGLSALSVTACTHNLYQFPLYNFAGRPIPPSQLAQRVLVGVTFNGSNGGLIILDGLRDIRNNLQNTIAGYSITGYSGGYPSQILNYPEELRAYVYSAVPPYNVGIVNYSTEGSSGSAGSFGGPATSLAVAPDFVRVVAAVERNGQVVVVDQATSTTYALNLPNVYKVATNRGDTVTLAMVRNSNTLYRLVKLNANALNPPGAIDCQPTILPVYCIVPVPGTFDRPYDAVFSLDGSNAYVLNCGQECGGGTNGGAGLSLIAQGSLQINLVPTALPYPAVVTGTVPIPGGVTTAILDSNYLYAAGQQLQPGGLFAGNLSLMNLNTLAVSAPVSISDGSHSKMLFADDNTLWIGSQACANGQRQFLAANGNTTQAANYNCLTRVALNGTTQPSATIVPAVNQNVAATPVPYPNTDNNLFYYGSLTGICWVQNYHKVYTAYGGQVHAFLTADGSEINNTNITVQGTALDVAYMDALSNSAN